MDYLIVSNASFPFVIRICQVRAFVAGSSLLRIERIVWATYAMRFINRWLVPEIAL